MSFGNSYNLKCFYKFFFINEVKIMIFKNYPEFNLVFKIFEFCKEYEIRVQHFDLSADNITESMITNQEVILRLIKAFYRNDNETQKKKLLQFLKHVIVDKNDYVLISSENEVLRFIYYINEFYDYQKISYRKDFLNFNANNYYKQFVSKGKICMLNIKGIDMDKNNRYFIIEKDLYDTFKKDTDKNYLFEIDINRSYIYSYQRRKTRANGQKTNLSDILDFVKKYHTVGFDYDKAQESFEYYEYLVATYFEYYKHGPESLLDFLEHKLSIVNDISGDCDNYSHNAQYYIDLVR